MGLFLFFTLFFGINTDIIKFGGKDTFVHLDSVVSEYNEGANPYVYLSIERVGLFGFEIEKVYENEFEDAYIEIYVMETADTGHIEIYDFGTDFEEGEGVYYRVPPKDVVLDSTEGATLSSSGGATWNFEEFLDDSDRKVLLPNHFRGWIRLPVGDIIRENLEESTFALTVKGKDTNGLHVKICSSNHPDSSLHPRLVVEAKKKGYAYENDEIKEMYYFIDQEDQEYVDADPAREDYVKHVDFLFEGHFWMDIKFRNKGSRGSLYNCLMNPNGEFFYDEDGEVTHTTLGRWNPEACPRGLSKKMNFGKEKFFGNDKLNLHPTLAWRMPFFTQLDLSRTNFGYTLARDIGVPTSMSNGVVLYKCYKDLYGYDTSQCEYLGYHENVEQQDDKFTEDRYLDDKNEGEGTLYKEIWPSGRTDVAYFESGYKEGVEDHAPIVALSAAMRQIDVEDVEAVREFMDQTFFVDELLRMLADRHLNGNFDAPEWIMRVGPPCVYGTNGCFFETRNVYLYLYQQEGLPDKWKIHTWDVDYVGSEGAFFGVSKWFEDAVWGSDECLYGTPSGRPGSQMRNLKAQCDPLFKMLKVGYWEEYKALVNVLVQTKYTEEKVDKYVEKRAELLGPIIPFEPSGRPTVEEHAAALEWFKLRVFLKTREAFDDVNGISRRSTEEIDDDGYTLEEFNTILRDFTRHREFIELLRNE